MPLPIYNWKINSENYKSDDTAPHGIALPIWKLIRDRFPKTAENKAELESFLNPRLNNIGNPFEIPTMAEAVTKIETAIKNNDEIVVFGDFDADGVTATAILTSLIRECGGTVRPFIPFRAEGYGLTEEAVSRCLSYGTPKLLITVDCGMGAAASLKRFIDAGAQVIVTDHHIPGEELPSECTIISTYQDGIPESLRHLCGAGLAFKVACGLVVKKYPKAEGDGLAIREKLFSWLDALSIATVADVVPLTGENRTYVSVGIKKLSHTKNEGLKALIRTAFDSSLPAGFTPYHLGFILGPHINSAGRMASAETALNLLLSDDPDNAKANAVALKTSNFSRKTDMAKCLKEAEDIISNGKIFDPEKDGAVIVAGFGWSAGVVGLIAARLSEKYMRPAIVATILDDGTARGSVRAPQGYNAYSALSECHDCLIHFGGHESAAGILLKYDEIDTFRKAFSDAAYRQVSAPSVKPDLDIASWLGFGDINSELISSIQMLQPCGEGNPEPVWGLKNVMVKAKIIGKSEPKSLALTLTGENESLKINAVWFKNGVYLNEFEKYDKWDIVGKLQEDYYAGEVTIKFIVTDARPVID